LGARENGFIIDNKENTMNIKKRETPETVLKTIIILPFAVMFMLPLLWMASSSLKMPLEVFQFPVEWIPKKIRWSNYVTVWTNEVVPFTKLYFNSIYLVTLTLLGNLLFSSLAAYAFAKLNFKGKNLVFMLLLGTMMIPMEVTVIPKFILFKTIGLYNNFWSVIIPGWYSITSIFLLRQFYLGLPNDLFDAARVDGASHLRIWGIIVMPLTKQALLSLSILGFIGTWNDYFTPLIFLVRRELYTVSLGIQYYLLNEAQEYNLTMAAASSAIVPIVLLFIIGQRYFVEGIASTGVKG
jgi:multiple sugar transport system permease protein